MKKTISINISGIVFHIEEDGYEKLKSYLTSIQRYFSAYEDSVEIIADIEGRIAEIFLAKLNANKQVITLEDVEKLIATMGNVADFAAIEEEEDFQQRAYRTSSQAGSTTGQRTTSAYGGATVDPDPTYADYIRTGPKRLYRDIKRKLLGGVASGIAHHFSMDPLWVRLIFLVFFFGLFFIPPASGFILIAYVILWIVVPGSVDLPEDQQIKKLYRDPDRRVVGGVASGLASYFAVDETVVRLLFVLGIFAFGQGLIIYLVLWAITPEARTLTDKMQMQGEPVTLSNIESNIKKSLHVGENERESTFVKILLFPFRVIAAIFSGLSQAFGPMLRFGLDALRVLVGIFLMIFSVSAMVALLIALGVCLGWSTNYFGFVHLGDIPVEMVRRSFPIAGFVFAFIAAFIPFLTLGMLGLMMIVRRRLFPSALGWTIFSVWVISLIGIGITVPAFVSSFRSSYTNEKVQTFNIGNKTLLLKMRDAGEEEYQTTGLTLEGYDGNGLRLVQEFKARGRNREQAGIHAEMITYQVTQSDSVLTFDSNFSFREDALFRAQELFMTLQIPYEKKFVMDEDIREILRNTIYDNGYDEDQIKGNVWKFTKDSSLVCITCKEGKRNNRSHSEDYSDRDDDRSYGASVDFDEEENGDDEGYKKTFSLRDFDKLDMGSAFEIRVRQGDEFRVEARGDRKDVENLEVEVNGGSLHMGYENDRGFRFGKQKKVKIYITMPKLRAVEFGGASQSVIEGFESNEPVSINISGASQSKISMQAAKLDLEVSGASEVNMKGQSERLEARVSGASTLDAYELAANQVKVEASGASTARVSADQSLRAEASGASNIRYRGNPSELNKDSSGAGSVSKE
jgi:phage shock protein PspC (stress-responsive transcriptional regulator)